MKDKEGETVDAELEDTLSAQVASRRDFSDCSEVVRMMGMLSLEKEEKCSSIRTLTPASLNARVNATVHDSIAVHCGIDSPVRETGKTRKRADLRTE